MLSHVHPVPFALASASSSCEGCNHLRTGSTKSLHLRWTWKVENYWDIKGPRPGTRNLSVAGLKLPLGHFSFHWAKAGQKESMLRVLKLPLGARPGPRSLSVTGLETAVGCWALFVPLGRRPGSRSLSAYLLRVLKLHIRYAVIFLNAASCLLCFLHVLS